ncbi:MAG: carbonate dehydratase [Balneolaceae bacterium]|nr:carbonate dehydratase [Balneolaceae bacterium]
MSNLDHLFNNNKKWAERTRQEQPELFEKLSEGQTPEYLWIGCSDSRVPANQVVDMLPGQIFVHRNIANVVVHTDLNCLSVVQYAVEVLKVKHVIICGHYGCGGVAAAIDNQDHGLIDNWLRNIKEVNRRYAEELSEMSPSEKHDRLCELNVIEQVKNVANTTVVQSAWRNGANLTVHGLIYNLESGILDNLETSISSVAELEASY